MNLVLNKPFIFTVGSLSAVGKTTFVVALLAKIVKPTEKVYIITDESERAMFGRIKQLSIPLQGKVVSVYSKDKFNKIINLAILEKFNYVVIDCHQEWMRDSGFLTEIVAKLRANNISVLLTAQLIRNFESEPELYNIRPAHITMVSDYVGVINRRKPSKFEAFIYKILPFIPYKNMQFRLIKNRYGKQKSFNFHLNFNTLKITNF
jgi:hypothetical protein